MATLAALTLRDLISRLRLQLKRYAPTKEIEAEEAKSCINLAYLYYLMRLGAAKETDLVSRQTPINLVSGTYEYELPTSVLLVTGVVVFYGGQEFYLYRADPKLGQIDIETGNFPSDLGWSPVVKLIGRKVHLLPPPPLSITNGLVIEGTTFPALLTNATDAIDSVLHPSFHPLIELKATLFALKSIDELQHYSTVDKMLTEFEAMFDQLTTNRGPLREFVEDATYMEM